MISICLAFALGGLAGIVMNPEPKSGSTWYLYQVDGAYDHGRFNSIALDSMGNPHISYFNRDDGDLMYAKWNGYGFDLETVDSNGTVGWTTSIAIDSNDYPHISYNDMTNSNLKYAKWDGTDWVIETVDNSGNVYYYSSLVLDSNDYPHIAYYQKHGTGPRYTYWDGSSWNTYGLASTYVGYYISVRLDSNEEPHIGFHTTHDWDLMYAKWSGFGFNTETVSLPGEDAGSLGSMALDSSDQPHMSYRIEPTDDLNYAKCTLVGGSCDWTIDSVISTGVIGASYLNLDSSEYPQIAFRDGDTKLQYASWDGSSWGFELVDPDNASVSYLSSAIDGDGNPHISYSANATPTLMYATKAELVAPPCEVEFDFDPNTLNLKSNGRWITAYFTSNNCDVNDIDPTTLLMNGAVPPERWEMQANATLMVKFGRALVQATVTVGDGVVIEVTGTWMGGMTFSVTDTIRVIDPPPDK